MGAQTGYGDIFHKFVLAAVRGERWGGDCGEKSREFLFFSYPSLFTTNYDQDKFVNKKITGAYFDAHF